MKKSPVSALMISIVSLIFFYSKIKEIYIDLFLIVGPATSLTSMPLPFLFLIILFLFFVMCLYLLIIKGVSFIGVKDVKDGKDVKDEKTSLKTWSTEGDLKKSFEKQKRIEVLKSFLLKFGWWKIFFFKIGNISFWDHFKYPHNWNDKEKFQNGNHPLIRDPNPRMDFITRYIDENGVSYQITYARDKILYYEQTIKEDSNGVHEFSAPPEPYYMTFKSKWWLCFISLDVFKWYVTNWLKGNYD